MSTLLQTAQEAINDYNEFQHAGVKGMKWGIRKSKYDKLSKKIHTKDADKQTSNIRKVARAQKKGKITDAEFKHLALKIDRKRPLDHTTVSKRGILASTALPAGAGFLLGGPVGAILGGAAGGSTAIALSARNENARNTVLSGLE